MKSRAELFVLGMLVAAAAPVAAQTITTPPRSLHVQAETAGFDSTYQGNIQPNVSSSSITLLLGSGAPAPVPPPAPPPLVFDPSICMANGGMPYTITPVAIHSGSHFANDRSFFSGSGKPEGFARGRYDLIITFDGQSKSLTATCTGLDPVNHTSSDSCDATTTVTVGPGTFVVDDQATSTFPQDVVRGSLGGYSGHGTVTQTNCH